MGKSDAALQFYDKVLAINPDNITALIEKARLLAESDQSAQALECVQKVNALRPNDTAIAGQIGRIAFLAGDHVLSARLLQRAVNSSYKDPQLDYYFAEALLAIGRITDAKNALENLESENASALALFLEKINPALGNEIDFQEAALHASASNYPLAIMWIEALSAKVTSDSQAITAFEELLDKFPEFTPAKRDLAIIYVNNGNYDETVYKLTSDALETRSDDPELQIALGILEFEKANFKRAVELLESGNAKLSKDATVQFYLGMALNQSGEISQSIGSLERALDLGLSKVQAAKAKATIRESRAALIDDL